jgi:hypothetical protein
MRQDAMFCEEGSFLECTLGLELQITEGSLRKAWDKKKEWQRFS